MSKDKRAQRAAREEKKAREKRVRRVQRDIRRSQVRMTVVSASQDSENAMSLVHETQQCNSALLYADEVTLVSPRASLLKNAKHISESDGIELLRVFKNVAPRFFPDINDELRSTFEVIDSLPPRARLPLHLRNEYDSNVRVLIEGLRPTRQTLQENVELMFGDSGYDQLQDAVDAGILTIDDMSGAVIDDITEDGAMVLGFAQKIDEVLSDGGRYPLFDADANNIVRLGVEAGFFSPVPWARRLGADAAMELRETCTPFR